MILTFCVVCWGRPEGRRRQTRHRSRSSRLRWWRCPGWSCERLGSPQTSLINWAGEIRPINTWYQSCHWLTVRCHCSKLGQNFIVFVECKKSFTDYQLMRQQEFSTDTMYLAFILSFSDIQVIFSSTKITWKLRVCFCLAATHPPPPKKRKDLDMNLFYWKIKRLLHSSLNEYFIMMMIRAAMSYQGNCDNKLIVRLTCRSPM